MWSCRQEEKSGTFFGKGLFHVILLKVKFPCLSSKLWANSERAVSDLVSNIDNFNFMALELFFFRSFY